MIETFELRIKDGHRITNKIAFEKSQIKIISLLDILDVDNDEYSFIIVKKDLAKVLSKYI